MGEQRIVGTSDAGNVLILREDRIYRQEGFGPIPDRNIPEVHLRIGVDFANGRRPDGRADVILDVTGPLDPNAPASASLVAPVSDPLLYSPGIGRVLLNAGLRHHNGVLDEDSTRRIIDAARGAERDARVLGPTGNGPTR